MFKEQNLLEYSGLFVAIEDIFPSKRKRLARPNSETRQRTKIALCQKQHGLCALCGKNVHLHMPENHEWAASIDHIIPKSRGGGNKINNLQLTHRKCNHKRGNELINKFPKWFHLDNHELI